MLANLLPRAAIRTTIAPTILEFSVNVGEKHACAMEKKNLALTRRSHMLILIKEKAGEGEDAYTGLFKDAIAQNQVVPGGQFGRLQRTPCDLHFYYITSQRALSLPRLMMNSEPNDERSTMHTHR